MCVCGRTISGKDSWLGAGGLAHEDGSVRVVLLHGGVCAVQEGPVFATCISQWIRKSVVAIGTGIGSEDGRPGKGNVPCGGALLGGLAEKEAELLEALSEDVFARHGDVGEVQRNGGDIKNSQRRCNKAAVIRSAEDDWH